MRALLAYVGVVSLMIVTASCDDTEETVNNKIRSCIQEATCTVRMRKVTELCTQGQGDQINCNPVKWEDILEKVALPEKKKPAMPDIPPLDAVNALNKALGDTLEDIKDIADKAEHKTEDDFEFEGGF